MRQKSTPVRSAPRRTSRTDSVGKTFAVLRCFVDGQEEWGVRELAAALGQPTSTVHRMLKILRREGMLEFDEAQQKYRVGLELVRIGAVVSQRTRLVSVAAPVMKDLVARTAESAWLALYEPGRQRTIYVAEQRTPHPLHHPAPIGREAPLTGDLTGHVVLAFLPEHDRTRAAALRGSAAPSAARLAEIRLRGYAVDATDGGDAAVLIAAPILDAMRIPAGALVLAVPRHRYRIEAERELGTIVVDAASRISHFLGAQLLGGASAGSWRDGFEIIAGLMGQHVAGLVSTPSLGGGSRNLIDLREGRGAYCMTTLASLHAAYHGLSPFATPSDRLRMVMSLSRLHLHVIARPGVTAKSFRDLRRYRVSPGLIGFSTFNLFQELLGLSGITEADFRRAGGDVVHFDYPEAKRQFEAGHIDVLIWLTGTPSALIRELALARRGRMLEVEPELIEALVKRNPAFETTVLPAGTYPNQDGNVCSLSVRTVLATVLDRHSDEVYAVARSVFERRDELARVAPAYAELDLNFAMVPASIPFHEGAARYWMQASVGPGEGGPDMAWASAQRP